jgi:hypothetical protein
MFKTTLFILLVATVTLGVPTTSKVTLVAESFFDAFDTSNDGFWQQQEVQAIASLSSASIEVYLELQSALDVDQYVRVWLIFGILECLPHAIPTMFCSFCGMLGTPKRHCMACSPLKSRSQRCRH